MHSTKNENPISLDSPSVLKAFFLAARPKTWSAGLCPVLVGACVAAKTGPLDLAVLFLTLLFSLGIQIGTNFANDYFDFINAADTSQRVGPKRAVQQGWIQPKTMLCMSLICFGFDLFCAVPLMMIAGAWSMPIAVLCVALGILYTGGPKPLGYLGLGELLVFIFFGPLAVLGTFFLQTGTITMMAWLASLPSGLLSAAILTANNLRDEQTDRAARKNTIVVRFGRKFGNLCYTGSILAAALVSWSFSPWILLPYLTAIPLIRTVFSNSDSFELIPILPKTSLLLLLHTLAFCLFS